MIDLYFWPTPNCYKVSILLEELMLPYNVIGVHIGKGQQFEDRFTDLNPNGKVPVLVDYDGPDGKPITIFESGAIMMFLSEKAEQFLPKGVRDRMKEELQRNESKPTGDAWTFLFGDEKPARINQRATGTKS